MPTDLLQNLLAPYTGGADPSLASAPNPLLSLAMSVALAPQQAAPAPTFTGGVGGGGGAGGVGGGGMAPGNFSEAQWQQMYQNGQIPLGQLVKVEPGNSGWEGGYYLNPGAGAAFRQMDQLYMRQHGGDMIPLASAYRTLAHQQSLVDRLGLIGHGGVAAPVGSSPHGWGFAIDVSGDPAQAWLRQYGERFGFHPIADPGQSEDWHFNWS